MLAIRAALIVLTRATIIEQWWMKESYGKSYCEMKEWQCYLQVWVVAPEVSFGD